MELETIRGDTVDIETIEGEGTVELYVFEAEPSESFENDGSACVVLTPIEAYNIGMHLILEAQRAGFKTLKGKV